MRHNSWRIHLGGALVLIALGFVGCSSAATDSSSAAASPTSQAAAPTSEAPTPDNAAEAPDGGVEPTVEATPAAEQPADAVVPLERAERSAIQAELEAPGPGRTPTEFSLTTDAEQVRLELTANYWNSDPADTIILDRAGDQHSVTLHLGDGQWLYRFRVDGEWVSDPSNPSCVPAEQGQCNSVVDVGQELELTRLQPDVPTGTLIRTEIPSAPLEAPQPLLVHLPPGYDETQTYPLLMVLHGYDQGATEWFDVIELHTMLDNMYATGAIEPMIVVAPEGGESFYRFLTEIHIVDEVLPYVESNWSVSTDPAQRAITGWSMGGFGALHLGWNSDANFGLAAPVSAGGNCFAVLCDQRFWDESLPGTSDVYYSLFVGENDDLGIVANHGAIAQILDDRGSAFSSRVVDYEGQRTDGHSARFLRRLVPELVQTVDAFFAQEELPVAAGCPDVYPDWKTSPYVLPYEVGTSFPMGLDNCSSSFHRGSSPDAYAYDFNMKVGTPILAARGGTVSYLDESQPSAGGGVGNLVIVDHGDGTSALYLHSAEDDIEVEIGDVVDQGDLLGFSGRSGLAGYPHLHFIVVKNPTDFPYQGVPVTFSNTRPNERGLLAGQSYEALPE